MYTQRWRAGHATVSLFPVKELFGQRLTSCVLNMYTGGVVKRNKISALLKMKLHDKSPYAVLTQ